MIALYLIGGLLLALLVGVVIAPLLMGGDSAAALEELPPEERREAALEAIRELEFEREAGKLSGQEYRRLRARYERAAERVERAAETSDPEEGRCSACGAELGPAARFCSRCGASRRTGRPRSGGSAGEQAAEAPDEAGRSGPDGP